MIVKDLVYINDIHAYLMQCSGVARPGPSRAKPDLTIDYHMPSNLHAKRQSLDRDLCS